MRGIREKRGIRGGIEERGKIGRGGNLEAEVGSRIETGKERGKNREKKKGKSRGGGKGRAGIKIKIDKEKGRKYLQIIYNLGRRGGVRVVRAEAQVAAQAAAPVQTALAFPNENKNTLFIKKTNYFKFQKII
jgi:hypothetical protein